MMTQRRSTATSTPASGASSPSGTRFAGRGTRCFSMKGHHRRTRRAPPNPHSTSRCHHESAVKSVGKLDAGNPHVQFDEREREMGITEWPKLPRPSSDATIPAVRTQPLLRSTKQIGGCTVKKTACLACVDNRPTNGGHRHEAIRSCGTDCRASLNIGPGTVVRAKLR
jgi:hypothetical protein